MLRKLAIALFCFFCMTPMVALAIDSGKTLFCLLQRRLLLMKQVAAYKFTHQEPVDITIPEREAMTTILNYAYQMGLNDNTVQPFMIVELMIGKYMQLQWMNYWKNQGLPQGYVVQSLYDQLIPESIRLDKKIMDLLVLLAPTFNTTGMAAHYLAISSKWLCVPFLTMHDRGLLVKALLQVRMQK